MNRDAEVAQIWALAIPHSKTFQRDDCPVVRTGYGKLEKLWKTITKAAPEHQRDALMRKIEIAIGRQKAFRIERKVAGVFLEQPVGITVWLGEKRWMNDVVLKGEDEPEKMTNLCSCGAEVNVNINMNGQPTGKCWPCYEKLRATG